MALIALVSAILYSSLFLFFSSSTNSLISDMLLKQYSSLYPSSVYGSSAINAAVANPFEAIMKDARLLILVDISFLVGIYIVSFCTSVTTVIVSAASYNNNNNSKNFSVEESSRSWNIKPALITSFYTTLLSMGYLFAVLILVAPLLTFFITAGTTLFSLVFIVSGIIASILYIYLNVEWILALVISLTEENNYGIQGLGRAGVLINIEGKKVQGFILNLSFYILSWILSTGFIIIFGKKAIMANQTAFRVYASVLSCLMNIFQLVTYTVLYFHCKKEHCEEIVELQSSVGYQKVSLEPPFSDAA